MQRFAVFLVISGLAGLFVSLGSDNIYFGVATFFCLYSIGFEV